MRMLGGELGSDLRKKAGKRFLRPDATESAPDLWMIWSMALGLK
jgi:hypothetical protein